MEEQEIKTVEVASDSLEALADNIDLLSQAIVRLESGKLNRRAILILLKHDTNISMRQIEEIFSAIKSLPDKYCNKPEKLRK